MRRGTKLLVTLVVVAFVLLVGWSVLNPSLDLPVISRVVCSIKGGTWTDGSVALGIPTGRYKVKTPSTTSSGDTSRSVTYECEFCYPVGDPPGWPEYHNLGLGDPPGGFPALVIGSPDNPCLGQPDASGNLHCM